MTNEKTTQSNHVAEAVKILSGVMAAPFVDMLVEICEDDGSVQGICNAIAALGEENRAMEATQLIRALLDILKMNCPDELDLLEEDEAGSALFVQEFVADLIDILYQE